MRWLRCVLVMSWSIWTVQAQDLGGLGDIIDAPVRLATLQDTQAQPGKRAALLTESAAVEVLYTGVALSGFSADRALQVWVQFEAPVGGWTDWQPLYLVFSATDTFFMAAYRGEVQRGEPFRLRFDTNTPEALEVLGAGTFDATRDDRDAPTAHHHHGERLPFLKRQAVDPPFLHTRASWDAAPYQGGSPVPLANPDYQYLTLHHAAGFKAMTLAEGQAQVKAIQDFHQNGRGWSDIGYHFILDGVGNVYQGRPFLDPSATLDQVPALARGAHAGGANTGNIGVCLLGCYHPAEGTFCEDEITPQALDSLVTLFAFLGEQYEVPETSLFGHRDFGNTSCPGDNNYQLLGNIRDLMAETQQDANETPPSTSTLTAAFPNPATDEATIRYFLTTGGTVHATVYDPLGREVIRARETFQEGGIWHTLRLDTAALSSGVYVYRVQVQGFSGVSFSQSRTLAINR